MRTARPMARKSLDTSSSVFCMTRLVSYSFCLWIRSAGGVIIIIIIIIKDIYIDSSSSQGPQMRHVSRDRSMVT